MIVSLKTQLEELKQRYLEAPTKKEALQEGKFEWDFLEKKLISMLSSS